MKNVKLFVDVSVIPQQENRHLENSRKVVDFVEKNLKPILSNGLLITLIPIDTVQDKRVLVDNGITKLPTLLDNSHYVVGLDSIRAFVNKIINGGKPRNKKDETDILREDQMAEMDMEKYEAGDYDDDEDDDDGDVFVKGDKDARKENIQQKIAQFNARRKGRVEDTTHGKRGSRKRKPTKHRHVEEDPDDEPDNVEEHRPRKGGADLNVEDWDPETQQLLDKAGN